MAPRLLLPSFPLLLMAGTASAVSIKDDDLVLSLKGQLQARANFLNDATAANGDVFDPLRNAPGHAEEARYVVRRAMLGLNGKYGSNFRAVIQMRGGENTALTGTGTSDPFNLWFAYAEANADTGVVNHAVKLGLDKTFNTESTISSTDYLFPTDRPIATVANYRGVGAAYRLTGPFFAWGIDQQNNSTGTKDPQANSGTGLEQANGLYYSTRIELSPGADWWIKRRTESFVGRAGTEAMLGFDVGFDKGSLTDNAVATSFKATDKLTWGPDLLIHWEKLSFLSEVRWIRSYAVTTTEATGATSDTTTPGVTWNVQAGYAIPLPVVMLEPCLRFSRIDSDRNTADEATVYGNGENGASGRQWDAGLNVYWFYKGHDLKTQVAYSRWQAEGGDGAASFLRVQQQVAF